MKRAAVPLILFLFGFILGLLCLFPGRMDRPADVSQAPTEGREETAFSSKDTAALLRCAADVASALKDRNYSALATYVHPERGVTFSPYSTVDLERDQCFTADQIRDLEQDGNRYLWGFEDGRGEPIQLTISQFLEEFIFSVDYTQAPTVGVDEIVMSGNSLENLQEVYRDCRFVDLCYPGLDPAYGGLDWCSLKMVFAPGESGWGLVGLIHSQWTI